MKDCCAIQLGAGLGGASTAHGYRRCAHAVNNERGTSLKLVGASEAEVRVNNCFLPTSDRPHGVSSSFHQAFVARLLEGVAEEPRARADSFALVLNRRVSLGAWSENASEVCVVLFGNGCGSWVRRGEMRGGGDFSVWDFSSFRVWVCAPRALEIVLAILEEAILLEVRYQVDDMLGFSRSQLSCCRNKRSINLRGILSMATEKSGAEFPPKIVEVAHLDDTDVKTPQPPKLEDMVEPNQNSFTALESGTSTKIEAESTAEAVKNLDLKDQVTSEKAPEHEEHHHTLSNVEEGMKKIHIDEGEKHVEEKEKKKDKEGGEEGAEKKEKKEKKKDEEGGEKKEKKEKKKDKDDKKKKDKDGEGGGEKKEKKEKKKKDKEGDEAGGEKKEKKDKKKKDKDGEEGGEKKEKTDKKKKDKEGEEGGEKKEKTDKKKKDKDGEEGGEKKEKTDKKKKDKDGEEEGGEKKEKDKKKDKEGAEEGGEKKEKKDKKKDKEGAEEGGEKKEKKEKKDKEGAEEGGEKKEKKEKKDKEGAEEGGEKKEKKEKKDKEGAEEGGEKKEKKEKKDKEGAEEGGEKKEKKEKKDKAADEKDGTEKKEKKEKKEKDPEAKEKKSKEKVADE
nr:cylicin-2-like [Physcomitrium patens]|eukprot:XP_024375860.1 cylicin-2-like [Physcomitrella patens]